MWFAVDYPCQRLTLPHAETLTRAENETQMATRPIFIVEAAGPALVRAQSIEFTWHAGMAPSRRQMSMRSLHDAARSLHPTARILEVSRLSDSPLGEALSAFNLKLDYPGIGAMPVECAFQSSKVFERGGPFPDLLTAAPLDAKRDPRLKDSGQLTGFHFMGRDWPKDPPTAFYDWTYMQALHQCPDLSKAIIAFDIFTDIAFNPAKSINCQASACARYVALFRRGDVEAALASYDAFMRTESRSSVQPDNLSRQGSLF